MLDDPVLIRLLADVDTAQSGLRAYLTQEGDDSVPLKTAATVWRVTDEAALMRARRGRGFKRGNRWFVRRSDL